MSHPGRRYWRISLAMNASSTLMWMALAIPSRGMPKGIHPLMWRALSSPIGRKIPRNLQRRQRDAPGIIDEHHFGSVGIGLELAFGVLATLVLEAHLGGGGGGGCSQLHS